MAIGRSMLGDGPHKVIALHGWFGDETCYQPMRDAIDTGAFTYAFMACRGYGVSKQQKGVYTMKEIAADAISMADELGWDRFSLVGHSMGGKAIQRVLADAPKRVRSMVAITPVPAADVPFDAEGWKLFDGAADNLDNRRGILNFSTGGKRSPFWVDRMARYSEMMSTREAFAAYLLAWAKGEFVSEINGNKVPVKVIVGENDAALTADVMKATFLTWYPNAELEVMANAGHYPMNETPVALASSIETFLKKVPG